MYEYGLRDLTVHSDARGSLVALETGIDVDFEIGRVFYIYGNVHNLPRAGHRNTEVHELIVCLNGSCLALVDDGEKRGNFLLDRRDRALYVPPRVWVELVDFTPDCVLLVLASGTYRPEAQIPARPPQRGG